MQSKEEIESRKQLKDLLKQAINQNDDLVSLKLDKIACKTLYSYIEQLETDKQKLIEKLEADIEVLDMVHDNYIDANVIEGTYETLGRLNYAKEILKNVKGEK